MEGKVIGVTVHNTDWISVASGTTPAEQYTRATVNGNMKDVRVHYYVDNTCTWQNLPLSLSGWHAADGSGNGNRRTIAIECIMSSAYNVTDKKSEGNVAVQGAKLDNTALPAISFDMDKDIVFLAVNDDKQEGVSGSSMDQVSIAEETTTSGNYYANAYIVVEKTGDKNILAIVYDADNNRLDGEPVYNASGVAVH